MNRRNRQQTNPNVNEWLPAARSIRHPFPLGRTADGTEVNFALWRKEHGSLHPVVGGATGGGKTNTLNVITAGVISCADSVLWNIDVAKKLIMYLIDPQVFDPMVQAGGGLFLPAYKNQWTDDILKIDPNFAILKEIIFNPDPYTGTAYPADPNAAIDSIIAASIPSQMMANVTTGSMTPEQAVEDAHNRIVQIFEEAGLPQS